MGRLLICLMTLLGVVTAPAYARDANEYLQLALKSSSDTTQIEDFTKALELNPKLAVAYAKRGMLYYFQERYDRVIEDYENYARLVPGDADGYRMLGMGYLRKGRLQEAISSFNKALQVQPRLLTAITYRAEAERLSGNDEGAIVDSTKAVELRGDPRVIADAYVTRAKVYRKLGRDELAQADVQASLQIDPRYVFYRALVSYANPEDVRRMGLVTIIALAFVAIFRVSIAPPKKKQ
jgi:tetratricopeptide (TPR) repeat protein